MIDLHLHSYYSNDGEYSPITLVKKCAKCGIKTMSITDHNTVRATEEAIETAKEYGIAYIPGIEIDCVYENTNFHVLGYGINYKNSAFFEIENHVRKQGLMVSYGMLEKTRKLGFDVTEEDILNLSKGSYWPETWTGEMFAEILLSKTEYENHSLLKPYRAGGKRGDNPYVNFYWDFYSQGKPCYSDIIYPSMKDVIEIIHYSQGIAVLAHPHVNLNGKQYLLEGIVKLGIDGIETFSSYHSLSQAINCFSYAKDHHLLATSGSDFHGKTKPEIKLGQHGSIISENEIKEKMTKLLKKKNL